MHLASPTFNNGQTIPQKYGRDFDNVNPPLTITNVPEGTKSLVLFMEDPDLPASASVDIWDHWIVFNIPPIITQISEDWIVDGIHGKNSRGELCYGGPRPPDREHRYFFKLFALNIKLDLPKGAVKQEIITAMQEHIIDTAELMGLFAPST